MIHFPSCTVCSRGYSFFSRVLHFVAPLVDLGLRLYVAWIFFKSGLVKIQSWDSTLALFEYEYAVPLLPFEWAAYLGSAAELTLPVLLALGLLGQFGALALFLLNVMAVVSYPDLSEVGLQQHLYWGMLLAFFAAHGTGKLSVDTWLFRSK